MKLQSVINIAKGLVVGGILAAGISSTACTQAKATGPAPPPEVEVVQVEQQNVPIYTEWIGTLTGMVDAQVKGQVSGYILSRNYTEGSFVRKGDLLFQIDPRTFQAALDRAKGDLAKAEAQYDQSNSQLTQSQAQLAAAEAAQGKTELDVKRETPLVKDGVAPQQDLDNAVQANLAAIAQVKAAKAAVSTAQSGITSAKAAIDGAKAAVSTAQLNLDFTRITSPIDGIAGIAQAQVGDLVNPNIPNGPPLTVVSTVDPIKVYFTMTEQDYLKNGRPKSTQTANANLELEMVLADGSTYPQKGKFYVSDSKVDQKTGALIMIGVFPNPGNFLRPGQYAKLRAVTSQKDAALLVPQRSVTELQGSYQVAVVNADHKIEIRTVKAGERVGSMWIIEDGLKAGETVVAEGTQKVRAGTVVTTKPYTAANAAPPATH